MKIIDRKGRLFEKISFLDLLIVALVALVLFFVYTFFVQGEDQVQRSESKDTVEYVVEIKDVNEAFTSMPIVGDGLYNSSKNFYIGEVVKVAVMPASKTVVNNEEGTYVLVESEDEYTVLITVKADVEVSDRFILVGSQKIRVGEMVPVKGKGYAGLSYIVEVDLQGEGN